MQSFAAREHAEMERVLNEPDRAPHIFVYLRNTDADADPWDEANWAHANPALGQFLSLQSLRDEAREARNDPSKENAFRQYRLNQWVTMSSRWMPMHVWDATSGNLWLNPDHERRTLAGRLAFGGLDLAAKFDLTAWCLLIPPGADDEPDAPADVLWRFWLPAAGIKRLDKLNDGKFSQWAKAGWITVTDGSVIDYDRVVADIALDAQTFEIGGLDCDEWSMWPIIKRVADACKLDPDTGGVTAYRNTYDRMSPGMDEVMGLVTSGRLRHHGNPVARFCFDRCEVRRAPYDPNLIRPSKPERNVDRARIDAVPTAAMAANAWRLRLSGSDERVSAYEDESLMVV
jgi:phage terminase large subunit-like protein